MVLELSFEERMYLFRKIILCTFTKALDLLSPASILDPKDDLTGIVPRLLFIFYHLHLVGSSIVGRSSVSKVTAEYIFYHFHPKMHNCSSLSFS